MSAETHTRQALRQMRETARALVLQIPGLPVGIWGTCFAVGYRTRLFIVTAAHLTKTNRSEHLRVAAAHHLRHSFRLGAGTVVSPPDDPDGLDVIVYPAGLGGFDEDTLAAARIVNLEPSVTSWQPAAYVSNFLVVGFPRELNEVDYDRGVIKTSQVMVPARYDSVSRVDGHVHRLHADNPLELKEFAGLSGSPVFSVEHQIAAGPHVRFCGVAITGSADSGLVQFVGVDAIRFVLDTAIEHQLGVAALTGPPV
jgi:hypothetical protein